MALSLILLWLFHPTKCLPTPLEKKIQTPCLVNDTGRLKKNQEKRHRTDWLVGEDSFATKWSEIWKNKTKGQTFTAESQFSRQDLSCNDTRIK